MRCQNRAVGVVPGALFADKTSITNDGGEKEFNHRVFGDLFTTGTHSFALLEDSDLQWI